MKLSTLLVVLFIFQVQAGKPIQRENGIWYTGKGCGVTTEIKYLQDVPEDDSNLQCTFIPRKDLVNYADLVNELFAAPTTTTITTTTITTTTTTTPCITPIDVNECFEDGRRSHKSFVKSTFVADSKNHCLEECRKEELCVGIDYLTTNKRCNLVKEFNGDRLYTDSRFTGYLSVNNEKCLKCI